MKQKPVFTGVLRRMGAVSLAAGTLWAAAVTAGSHTAATAVQSLQASFPIKALKWELGDLWPSDTLSTAAALTIGESPLLLSARGSIAEQKGQKQINTSPTKNPESVDTADKSAAISPPPDPSVAVPSRNKTSQTSDDPENNPEEPTSDPEKNTQPLDELDGTDNGVTAKTIVPVDPDGYTVWGNVFISTSTSYDLSAMDFSEPFDACLTDEAPQILILHTHGSEAYTPPEGTDVPWSGDHRSTDSRYNVVRVGDQMTEVFQNAGISVLHDRTLYDYPNYTDAYDRALAAIQTNLTQYPSIRFILDVHRDAIEDEQGRQYKVISDIEGRGTAAQITLVMGSDGSGLPHEHWRDNLRLAASLQQNILQSYPTLMRPLLLRKSRYNQHATTGSMLLEIGAAGNSPDEAALSGRIFAEQMVSFLEGLNK